MESLVIGVSSVVSPLCSSLLRVEPYSTCAHACTYCYAKWYRPADVSSPLWPGMLRWLEVLVRRVRRAGVKPVPVRLSTLSDPFQPCEEVYRASLKAMRVCLRYEHPLIVNCKGVLIARRPWASVASRLAERGLILVQVSLSTLDDHVSRLLEPGAPPPSERLKAAMLLGELGAPVAVRLSPFIPGVTDEASFEELAAILADHGVRHVIVESLRLPRGGLLRLYRMLGLKLPELEAYSLRGEGLLRPSLGLRLGAYSRLREALSRLGVGFSTCKEGLFHLHTTGDCCGMYMLGAEHVVRPTLYDLYLEALRRPIRLGELSEVYDRLSEERGYAEALEAYPGRVRRRLRAHDRRLIKVASSPGLLEAVTPLLVVRGGCLEARRPEE